jgi:uncharacterized protein YceH (UPF0502 family)
VNPLTQNEARVLGALIEKDITTPDYYPMSLNALINACNQKNNREPVTALDESAVRAALDGLQNQGLAGPAHGADSRVTKFEHRAYEKLNLGRREIAVLCVLLLRGAQTPGELRGRTERFYNFEDLADVQSTLQRLIDRDPPLVKVLPRQPGTKEARFIHLLAGDTEPSTATTATEVEARTSGNGSRLEQLEAEVAGLRQELAELKQQFAEFKKQFEG